MTYNKAEIVAWAVSQTRDFNQLCQALTYRACQKFGHVGYVYRSANEARGKSGKLNTSRNAPIGAIGYWQYGADGHVAISLGNDLWIMGSVHAVSWVGNPAHHIGVATSAQYEQRAGAKWLGWSRNNGINYIIPATSTASTGTTKPATPPTTPVIDIKGTTEMAPYVFNYKADTASNHWFRTWEFSIDETSDASVATQWKQEADQTDTLSSDGNLLNAMRAAVQQRISAFAKIIPTAGITADVDLGPVNVAISQLATQLGVDVAAIEAAVKAIPANPTEVVIPAVTAQLK